MIDNIELQLTTSLTPYDITNIVILYLYCIEDVEVPLEIFQQLISSTLESNEFNPLLNINAKFNGLKDPIPPFLGNIIDFLLEMDHDIVLKVIKSLLQINSIETVFELLGQLRNKCLFKSLKDIRERRKKQKKDNKLKYFTESSFLGQYFVTCLGRIEIGDFEKRDILFNCYKWFIDDFKKTEVYHHLEPDLNKLNFSLSAANNLNYKKTRQDQDVINIFQQYGKMIEHEKKPSILMTSKHLQNLLYWNLYQIISDNDGTNLTIKDRWRFETIEKLICNFSLHNQTVFPSVHLIDYFKYLKTNSYQEALDSLHNYFDYMLSQSSNSYFHVSLLCLATFHAHFLDTEIAIKCFDEASKVAREHNDAETLNIIIVWIINFIEQNPEHTSKFQIKVDQIIKFLKSCSDNVNATVFENAYRFESVLLLRSNSDYISTLEASFKCLVISLQQPNSERSLDSTLSFSEMLWDRLGYPSVSEVYRRFSKKDTLQAEIEQANKELKDGNFDFVKEFLKHIKLKTFKYDQKLQMALLEVQYHTAIKDYAKAIELVSERIVECVSLYSDFQWKYEFEKQKCMIFIEAGVGHRCIPLLTNMINHSHVSKNGLASSECLIIMCQILIQINKIEEPTELLAQNLSSVLKYSKYRPVTLELIQKLKVHE